MQSTDDIYPIWQPQGYSTYQITKDVALKLNKKTTHTGVLDPMAEGVIIVLAGEKRFEKNQFSEGKKTYEFDITFGIETDSFDGMGLITNEDFNVSVMQHQIEEVLKSFVGNYEQTVPLYSARKVNGKKLFYYPKENLPIPKLPSKKGVIDSLELLTYSCTSLENLVIEINQKIKNIKIGEFRQQEITTQWENYLSTKNREIYLTAVKVKVVMSRGLYVRSLSQDICKKLNTIGFVSNLVRTQNGKFTKKDCCTLKEVC